MRNGSQALQHVDLVMIATRYYQTLLIIEDSASQKWRIEHPIGGIIVNVKAK